MKTVLVTGTFDFLHRGHLHLLQEARTHGDRLIVLVARDSTVKKIKGRFPIHNERERRELVASVRLVDQAVLGDRKDPYRVIEQVKPDVICLGYDQQHTFALALEGELKRRGMKTRIVTLKPFHPERLKSTTLRTLVQKEESTSPRTFVAVTALVLRDGKILLNRRNDPGNKRLHKKWEFPGGGVEEGESIQECVIRETKEETGFDVAVQELVPYVHMGEYQGRSGFGHLFVITYICRIVGGSLAPHADEVLECRWVTPKEAGRYNLLPGNDKMIKEAVKLLALKPQSS